MPNKAPLVVFLDGRNDAKYFLLRFASEVDLCVHGVENLGKLSTQVGIIACLNIPPFIEPWSMGPVERFCNRHLWAGTYVHSLDT